jgi:hypothetical protein
MCRDTNGGNVALKLSVEDKRKLGEKYAGELKNYGKVGTNV